MYVFVSSVDVAAPTNAATVVATLRGAAAWEGNYDTNGEKEMRTRCERTASTFTKYIQTTRKQMHTPHTSAHSLTSPQPSDTIASIRVPGGSTAITSCKAMPTGQLAITPPSINRTAPYTRD